MNSPLVIQRADQLPWLPVPGLGGSRAKILRVDEEHGEVVFLAQLPAGAVFPMHQHHCRAMVWTLRGTWRYDEGELPVGTLAVEPAGLEHEASSVEDCELLVMMKSDDGRFMSAKVAGRWLPLDIGFFRKAAALNRAVARLGRNQQ